jgi:hypothetical protein
MMRRFAARVTPVTGARTLYVPVTEPLGKGRVVPLKFESLKPVYAPRTWTEQLIVTNIWLWSNNIAGFAIATTVIWACHGGFTGHLPPDPHVLFP